MFGPTSGFKVSEFASLVSLETDDAECILRQASKQMWKGSWYRSPLAWKMIALSLILTLGPIGALSLSSVPLPSQGMWFSVFMAILIMVIHMSFQVMLHRELSRRINRLLDDRCEIRT